MRFKFMYDTIHHESLLLHDIDTEYLKLINFYSQITRNSIFIKYFNIVSEFSTFEPDLFSTFDHYTESNIKFNIYELTPLFKSSTIDNSSNDNSEYAGNSLSGQLNIVVNTIAEPHINDIICFYPPHYKSEEIFRVSKIKTISYALHATPNVQWYELTLDYAPVEHTNMLKINNQFAYDLFSETNIPLDKYKENISNLSLLSKTFNELSTYYNPHYDVYLDDNKIPISVNNNIMAIKIKYENHKYNQLLTKYFSPYGFKIHTGRSLPYQDILSNNVNFIDYYDIKTKQFETYCWKDNNKINNTFEQLISISNKLSTFL